MENDNNQNTENNKPKFTEKYGVWLMVIGLIATIYVLKYILEFIEKIW